MRQRIVLLIIILLGYTVVYTEDKIDDKVPELEKQLEIVSGKEKIEILFQLATKTELKPDKNIAYCSQIIDIAEQTKNLQIKARALMYLSDAYNVKGDLETAIKYKKEGLELYKNLGNRVGMSDAMNSLGAFYINIDYFDTAQDYLMKALKIREEIGDKKRLYSSYLFLGILYYNLEDFQKALEYYQKTLTMVKDCKDSITPTACFFFTGICFKKLGNIKKALEYLQKAQILEKNSNYKYYTAISMSEIGDIYGNQNQYHQALKSLFSSQDIQEKNGYKDGLIMTKYYIGNVYLNKKDYSNAFSFYDQTLKLAEELKNKKMSQRVYEKYSDLYADMGNFKKAYEYYMLFSQTSQSILNEKKMKQISDLEIRYEAEKREKQLEILTKDNKIQQLTRNASIIGLILVLIILSLIFKKYLYLLAFWKMHKYIWQYRVIERIGTGGMGTVFRAHAISDKNHLVAVKVLKDELLEDESSRQRFKQEGMIIDKLKHPHIVEIFERGEHKGKLYIVMEYLRGKTLAQKIKEENRLDLHECFQIMIQAADALAFIHSKNVLHRDIKPANIMLVQKNGNHNFVKLLDFGVALMKFQTRLTQSGILVGTISYTAPEQITDNLYSPASDVYSLGMVFYEMLTGESAFPAKSVTAAVKQILDTPPIDPEKLRLDIPGELNRLIMKMLSKAPDQRPTAADLLGALKNINPTQKNDCLKI